MKRIVFLAVFIAGISTLISAENEGILTNPTLQHSKGRQLAFIRASTGYEHEEPWHETGAEWLQ